MTPGWHTTRPRTFTTAAAAKDSGITGKQPAAVLRSLRSTGAISPAENGGCPTAWAAAVAAAAVAAAAAGSCGPGTCPGVSPAGRMYGPGEPGGPMYDDGSPMMGAKRSHRRRKCRFLPIEPRRGLPAGTDAQGYQQGPMQQNGPSRMSRQPRYTSATRSASDSPPAAASRSGHLPGRLPNANRGPLLR